MVYCGANFGKNVRSGFMANLFYKHSFIMCQRSNTWFKRTVSVISSDHPFPVYKHDLDINVYNCINCVFFYIAYLYCRKTSGIGRIKHFKARKTTLSSTFPGGLLQNTL